MFSTGRGERREEYGFITEAEAADKANNLTIYRWQFGGNHLSRGFTVRAARPLAPTPGATVQQLVQDLISLADIPPHRRPFALCYATRLAAPLPNSFFEVHDDAGGAPAWCAPAGWLARCLPACSLPADAVAWDGSPAARLDASDATLLETALAAVRLDAGSARFSVVERWAPQERPPPGTEDIGEFVGEDSVGDCAAPGAAWLLGPCLPSPLPPPGAVAAVAAAVAAAAAQPPRGCAPARAPLPPLGARELVAAPSRAALIALVDAAWARSHGGGAQPRLGAAAAAASRLHPLAQGVAAGCTRDDFKLLLLPAQLRACIGRGAARALAAALGGAPHAIALRRTAASGRWINFHTDAAAATVQVPLSGDEACEGGKLVFAEAGGALRSPPRLPGVPLAHGGDEIHGVTRLLRGTRYGLFLLRARLPC